VGTPARVNTRTAAVNARNDKAQDVAVVLMRELLERQGSETKVSSNPITIDEIAKIASRNGLSRQFDAALRKAGLR